MHPADRRQSASYLSKYGGCLRLSRYCERAVGRPSPRLGRLNTQAIRLNPKDDSRVLATRSDFPELSARLDQAAADFTRAHELSPKLSRPLADRGMAYAWKNDRAQAEADFAKVRAIDRSEYRCASWGGCVGHELRKLGTRGREIYRGTGPGAVGYLFIQMRADAYQQMGEFEKARKSIEKLLEMSRSRKSQ